MGSGIVLGCSTNVPESVRPGKAAWCVLCCAVCRVVWQSTGATPLLVASQNGHVECVQALLSGGAAINQAKVGCARPMALPRGVCVCCSLYACTAHRIRWDEVLGLRGQGRHAHVVLEGMGNTVVLGCSTHAPVWVRSGKTAWCVTCYAVCCVVWQTDGTTPLLIASGNGHVECVRALLRGGVAINQAKVGCARPMTWPRGGCLLGDLLESACVHAWLNGYAGIRLWAFGGQGRRAYVVLEGMESGMVLGCSTHACTRVDEARRDGMVCDVLCCVPRGVAEHRGHATARGLSERTRGVRAGVVERGRGDQPGDGW
jgi:hypothetical protein